MRVVCKDCHALFEVEYRTGICPHDTLVAADGDNNFSVNTLAFFYLAPEDMIDQLVTTGWINKFTNVWRSPSGALFHGPALAWKMMKRYADLNQKRQA
jgi:hypothetical protein